MSRALCSGGLGRFVTLAGCLMAACGASLVPAAAQSSCTNVTTLADSGAGSLRAAIADTSAGNICFQTGLTGTITLGSTLSITRAVNITGPNLVSNAPVIVISGNNAVQPIVINASDDSGNALPVSIASLEVTGGSATGNTPLGGGIRVVGGSVTLNQMTITANRAEAGGGVYNQGTLTMTSCQVTSNNSTNGLGGGIVNLQGGSLTLQSTNVTRNNSNIADGGGIASSGTLVIQSGSIAYNNANGPDGGGGLFVNGGTTTISAGAVVSANTVTSQGADGAGLYNSGATVTITASAFLGNVVSGGGPQFGGAIYNTGTLSASESTFAGNSALTSGGGIYNNTSLDQSTSLTLNSVTISTNTATGGAGGGVENVVNEAPSLTMNNVIVAGNAAGSGTADCDGCGQVVGVANTIGGASGLGPLADNGGPTQTMMPLLGGAEIGSGNAYVTEDNQDQRGFSRLSNGSLDRGAVQDHYSSVTFASEPGSSQTVGQVITPAINITVAEVDGSTTNYPLGVPVTMLLQTQDSNGPPTLSGGAATYPTASTNPPTAHFAGLSINTAGSYYLQATTYPSSQDGQIATYSSLSGSFTVGPTLIQTQTALALSPLQPAYGTPETLTATVTESGTGALVQAGSVAFTDNGTALQTVAVTNGVATLSGVSLTVGQHVLVASYEGSSTDGASGGSGTFTVGKATPTVTVVTPPAVLPGAALTNGVLHATATGVNGVVLTGSYSFSPALHSVPAAGLLTVTATFTPTDTTNYGAGTGSATFTVLGASASGTTLSFSPASAYPGTAETLTATVAPADGGLGAVGGSIATTGGLGSQTLGLLPTTANFTSGSAVSFGAYAQLTAYSADLNGDGVTDQVLTNGQSSSLEVLLSDPASPGNFLAQQSLGTYGACYYVSSVAIGDVNRDGLPDLVAACQNIGDGLNDGGPIVLFLNQGNGSFAAPTAIGGQTGQTAGPMQGALVALGNFDGDAAGVLDLVSVGASCPNGGASCFAFQHGNGDGTFNAATYTQIVNGSTSDGFSNLKVADMNGDGIPDLAFLYKQNGATDVVVWKTNATTPVTFGVTVNTANGCCLENDDLGFNVGTPPTSLALSDLNGDGFTDLAVVTSSGDGSANTVDTFLNAHAGGSFFSGVTPTSISYPGAMSLGVADFNQDGHADLAVYSHTTNLISVLIGDGTGAFPTTWQGTVGITAPVAAEPFLLLPVFSVGDANGDGFPDLLIVEPTSISNASAKIALTGGDTQATYSTTAPQQSTTYTGTTTPGSKYWAGSSGSAPLTVEAGTVTLNWTPPAFTYGVDVPASDLQATATVNGQAAAGAFVYTFTSGAKSGSVISTNTVYPAGNYNVQVAFTPSGSTTTYTEGTVLVINQATPAVTVATPGTVLPGAVVSLANVHGTATGVGGTLLAGTFGYSPGLGTALTSGETVTVTFTPKDRADYVSGVSAHATAPMVLAAQATTTTLTPSVNPVLPGVTVGLTANVAPATGTAGAVPGSEAFSVTSATSPFKSANLALDPTTANFKASLAQTYTGSFDYNTYSADFNGDGVADLLVVPNGELPELLLSAPGAAPSLAAATPVNLGSTCSYTIGLAVGDVNGDALPDIAAACVNDQTGATTLVVVLNEGGGNFVPSPAVTTLSPGINSVQMVLGDFIKTGTQGLVVLTDCYLETCSPTLDYLQGDGAGNFSLVNYELMNNGGTSDSFANLLAADFSGDGYPDVAFLHTSNASPYGVVEVWTNSGGSQPTFGQLLSSAGPTYQYSATIAGGNGSATLYSLVSSDLNLDGKPDLALTTAVTSSDGSDAYSSISIALNQSTNGVLSFPSATTDTQGNGAVSSIVTADFDGDGVPDIALYDSYNSTVRVLHGTVGQGGSYSFAFTEPNLLFTVSAPSNLPVDIVHPLVGGHRGKKSSGLKPADSVIGDLIYPVLAVGDTNGDGYPDLLVGQVTTDQQTYNLIYQAQQFVTSGSSVGSTSITAPNGTTEYTAGTTPSSGFWAPSTSATTLSVTSIATTTSLAVPPGTPVYGTAFTLSSQVINTATGLPAAGGSVTFTEDGTALSTITIDASGKATSTSVMPTAGPHAFGAIYGGATGEGTSTATSQTVTVAKFTPTLNWATPAAITTTTPLSGTQLDATVAGVTGAALAGVFSYTPGSGTLTVGTHTLSVSFAPTDAVDYGTATAQVSIQVVAETITLASISPATTPLGTTPLPVTVTGSGFPAGAVVEVNGSALATTRISATQLGVTVPGADLAKAGTLPFTIYDAASQAISNALTLSVTAPTATAVVSAPATVTSAQQPMVGLTLANSYPVDIAGTFTLTFAPAGADGVDDPAVQFSSGGRTLNFTIAAGSTTGPTAQLQSGTVEGTIQVTTVLTAGGVDVTPADLQTPAAITVAGSEPTVTGVTFTNTNGLITVVVTGFSNTREMTEANFVFTGPGADSLASAGVTVPATSLFGSWYTSADSATYGSTFLYTQTFQLSDDTTNITGVAVTLTNTVGSSTSVSSQ